MGDMLTELHRVEAHRQRAAQRGLRADLRSIQWARRLRTFNGRCAYCGGPMETMDHVVPLANGGGTTFTNVVPCCLDCNARKGTAVWLPAMTGAGVRLKW
jgi:5-methylcytosine-specific restriction endonuclease McrA